MVYKRVRGWTSGQSPPINIPHQLFSKLVSLLPISNCGRQSDWQVWNIFGYLKSYLFSYLMWSLFSVKKFCTFSSLPFNSSGTVQNMTALFMSLVTFTYKREQLNSLMSKPASILNSPFKIWSVCKWHSISMKCLNRDLCKLIGCFLTSWINFKFLKIYITL